VAHLYSRSICPIEWRSTSTRARVSTAAANGFLRDSDPERLYPWTNYSTGFLLVLAYCGASIFKISSYCSHSFGSTVGTRSICPIEWRSTSTRARVSTAAANGFLRAVAHLYSKLVLTARIPLFKPLAVRDQNHGETHLPVGTGKIPSDLDATNSRDLNKTRGSTVGTRSICPKLVLTARIPLFKPLAVRDQNHGETHLPLLLRPLTKRNPVE
jgi:hypothetical protein